MTDTTLAIIVLTLAIPTLILLLMLFGYEVGYAHARASRRGRF